MSADTCVEVIRTLGLMYSGLASLQSGPLTLVLQLLGCWYSGDQDVGMAVIRTHWYGGDQYAGIAVISTLV